MTGGPGLLACSGGSSSSATSVPRLPLPPDSLLGHAATESSIDTVVVLTMENRSFDHYLGWLADDVRNVFALKGGWMEWKTAGYPIAVGPK